MYVVDTNILSEAAPGRTPRHQQVAAWMDVHSHALYLSVITIAEVTDGIHKARRTGATNKSDALQAWLETLLHLYAPRILPIDTTVALAIGALSDHVRAQGHAPGLADLAIAATAQTHGYTVLTRNRRHFEPLPVASHDPFISLPA